MCYKQSVSEFIASVFSEGVDWKFASTICRTLTKNGEIQNIEGCFKRIEECFYWKDKREYEKFIKVLYDIATVGQPFDNLTLEDMKRIICQRCIDYMKMSLSNKNKSHLRKIKIHSKPKRKNNRNEK
jgi:hypothetical protein